jgi:hypothetical protein
VGLSVGRGLGFGVGLGFLQGDKNYMMVCVRNETKIYINRKYILAIFECTASTYRGLVCWDWSWPGGRLWCRFWRWIWCRLARRVRGRIIVGSLVTRFHVGIYLHIRVRVALLLIVWVLIASGLLIRVRLLVWIKVGLLIRILILATSCFMPIK